ncbi:endo alphapolygalactosaminidase precursor [Diaporthe amygdali]|uniref:endo alphapolygalactosaminidase precursor n=1 Tax=Phomopsis amygdali TaxID=1214568 RepID=UPI0022FE0E9A|nr:endo alphapolygalactosaminidase precursor [Diaporthe amygdali]KAJ0119844.1 endo alphapolygalactosaminidase precursor [Diaporthe amygdali]
MGDSQRSTQSIGAISDDKPHVVDGPKAHRRFGWKKWAIAIVALVVILALALGLGLGLGLRNNGGGDEGDNGSGNGGEPTGPGNSTFPTPTSNLTLGSQWQIVLSETLSVDDNGQVSPSNTSNPGVSVYDIDMFLHQNLTVVRDLQELNMTVICYFSAGSYEPNRPDSWRFQDDDKGKELDGWPGEYWLKLTSQNVRDIMTDRIAIAADMGCNAIDPDNVDGYDNENGLDLSEEDSIDFMRFLAKEAANKGMITGLKNAAAIIDSVIDVVHFSVNEQCVQYDECADFAAFPNNDKPVFNIEYPAGDGDTDVKAFATNTVDKSCDKGTSNNGEGFNTVLKYMNLSGWVQYCNGDTYTTDGQ